MSAFLLAFVLAAGLLALWVDVRFPRLAPAALSRRVLASVVAFAALQAVPILHGSTFALYGTLFALLLPAFTGVFLTAVRLLRALRDARLSP
jgi:hypothetical protein